MEKKKKKKKKKKKIEQQDYTKTKGEDQTDTYIYYQIEQQASTKTKGEDQMDTYIYTIRLNRGLHQNKGGRSDGHIYIQKGKIRRTHTYTIRLNNRTTLKQKWKIRRTHIYTKGEDQTDTYIYTKEEDQTDTYIYY